jgi:hypothetical protein
LCRGRAMVVDGDEVGQCQCVAITYVVGHSSNGLCFSGIFISSMSPHITPSVYLM